MQLFPTRRFATLGIDQCKPRLLDRFGVADASLKLATSHLMWLSRDVRRFQHVSSFYIKPPIRFPVAAPPVQCVAVMLLSILGLRYTAMGIATDVTLFPSISNTALKPH
ncbi:hypothetical protein FPQ18DRAFT_300135 [Pyronema domesticum]|nr:hypothetical protein FPQ18DRAFT_300135 [Pyronema domesticum]